MADMATVAELTGKTAEKAGKVVQETRKAVEEKLGVSELSIPPFYLGFAAGSILLSLGLFAARKKEDAVFVGLWPPTILALGVFHRMVIGARKEP